MKYLLTLITTMFLVSCATNPFIKNYDGVRFEKVNTDEIQVMKVNGNYNPDVFMATSGYHKLGESNFTDYYKSREDAKKQAQLINATIVIVDMDWKEKVNAYVPTLIRTLGDENPDRYFAETVYQMNRFDYHVTYWVKGENAKPVSNLMTLGLIEY
ncbi:MAG: hypothetical protein JXR48_13180 [Candidatus Delongbacteria bacterium]|nr:hypothetical protein [Candidatus Delongbacteria bacterium]MBN2835907.1 hypothetical protein [Candidatus Delongbacteria bacterium]